MPKPWKLIAFDCDGVLVDSRGLVVDLLNQKFALDPSSFDLSDMFRGNPRDYDEALGIDLAEFMRDLAMRYHEAPLRKEVIEAIVQFRRANSQTQVVVITANDRGIVRNRLETEKALQLFDEVYGHASIDFSKDASSLNLPSEKANQLQWLIQNSDIESEQCCLIGDTTSDLNAARQAGVCAVGLAGGFQSAESLADDADHIIGHPSELLDFLLGNL